MRKEEKFGIISWLHLLFIIAAWISPFVFGWKIILVFIVLYYLQLIIFRDCILTIKQFKTTNRHSFYAFLLRKIGFNLNERKVSIVTKFIFPWIILFISVFRTAY